MEYSPFDLLHLGKPKVVDAYRRGVDYYRHGLYKSAVKELETVAPDHPKFKRAQNYLQEANTRVLDAALHIDAALEYRKQGELFKAKKEFEEALEVYPRHRRVQMLLEALELDIEATVGFFYEKGLEEFDRKRYEAARIAYLEALKADPEEDRILTDLARTNDALVRAYSQEGITLFEKGLLDEAVKKLEKAYRIRTDDVLLIDQLTNVYNRCALKYYREEELSLAVVDLRRSLEIKPDQMEIRNQLEQIQKRLGQLQEIRP